LVAAAAAAPNAVPATVFTASAALLIELFFAMLIALALYVFTTLMMVYCSERRLSRVIEPNQKARSRR